MSDQQPIGVIGLGLLGGAIADRLVESGRAVIGFDIDVPKTVQTRLARSATEIFKLCPTVLLSLPTSGHVAAILAKARPLVDSRHVVIDTTTGDPDDMIAQRDELALRQAAYLEANVAGSSELVRQGRAVLFLGGEPRLIAANRPLLDAISPLSFHIGPVGSASRFKLVHNLILGLNRAVLAEGLEFARSLGFDPAEALAILMQTPAGSRAMEAKGDRMVRRDYEKPQARLSQHLKDVCLILEQTSRSGAPTPLTETHRILLEGLEARGLGAMDNSVIMEAYRQDDGD